MKWVGAFASRNCYWCDKNCYSSVPLYLANTLASQQLLSNSFLSFCSTPIAHRACQLMWAVLGALFVYSRLNEQQVLTILLLKDGVLKCLCLAGLALDTVSYSPPPSSFPGSYSPSSQPTITTSEPWLVKVFPPSRVLVFQLFLCFELSKKHSEPQRNQGIWQWCTLKVFSHSEKQDWFYSLICAEMGCTNWSLPDWNECSVISG